MPEKVGMNSSANEATMARRLLPIGAGLQRKRPLWQKIYFKTRVIVFKILKRLVPFGLPETWLMKKFGSTDYRNTSGTMRAALVKTVNEDLSEIARSVSCPVALVYGMNDAETPPEIGQRLKNLIADAELTLLPGQDHYSVLGEGRHQVTPILKKFMEQFNVPVR